MSVIKFHEINEIIECTGLINNSSLCYLNSLIQSFCSCTSFNKYIKKTFIKNHKKDELVLLFYKFINDVNNNKNISQLVLNRLIYTKFKDKNFKFSGQQDVVECIEYLIELFNDKNIYNMFYHEYNCTTYCVNCSNKIEIPSDKSFQIIIPNDITDFKLDEYRSYQSLLNDFNCIKCHSKNSTYNIYRLLNLPPIIIINLNKYYKKRMVNFQKHFTITTEEKNYNYKLVSIIDHYGSQQSGHYTSRSLRNNGIYEFNDNNYILSNFEPKKESYILFYHLEK